MTERRKGKSVWCAGGHREAVDCRCRLQHVALSRQRGLGRCRERACRRATLPPTPSLPPLSSDPRKRLELPAGG
eukprot:350649-Chlamydomonas_euryale.AAC.8